MGILYCIFCRDGEDEMGIFFVLINGCWKVCWVGGLVCCWIDMLRCDFGMEVWCEYVCGRILCLVCVKGWCGGESGREGVVIGVIVGIVVFIVVGYWWLLWKVYREFFIGFGLYVCVIWDGRIGVGGWRIVVVFLCFFYFVWWFWNYIC